MQEQVWIYARGADMRLREAAGELLQAGRVSQVDLVNAAAAKLNRLDELKIGVTGRALVLVAPRDQLEAVFERLRFHVGEELRAWALPVLAAV